MATKYLDEDGIRKVLHRHFGDKPVRHWALDHGIDEGQLSRILAKKESVSPKVARALGYRKQTLYVKTTEE